MADESRGRPTEKEIRPTHQTQLESGEGEENLLEHNIDVQDFASSQRVDSNHKDEETRNLSDEALAAMRSSALAHEKDKKPGQTKEPEGRLDGGIFAHGSLGPVIGIRLGGEKGPGGVVRDEGSRSEFSASKHQPRLNGEKEGREVEDGERGGSQGFGQGSHGPVLRKPMLGERGHGPVVRGGRGSGRGRGGPGVSVMED
jgi:hypothetical protein